MSRFYFPPESFKGDYLEIKGKELHHIRDVMRLKEGEAIVAFDGRGSEYQGRIDSITKNSVKIRVDRVEKRESRKEFNLSCAISIPKKEKMDLVIQKLTELGIDEIIPILTERTVVRMDRDNAAKKTERWRKIATQASKQSGRNLLPEIKQVVKFSQLLDEYENYDQVFIPCLLGERKKLSSVIDRTKKNNLFLIGPEGGFTEEEIKAAVARGAKPVSLGENTLKTDTAAIAMCAILNENF